MPFLRVLFYHHSHFISLNKPSLYIMVWSYRYSIISSKIACPFLVNALHVSFSLFKRKKKYFSLFSKNWKTLRNLLNDNDKLCGYEPAKCHHMESAANLRALTQGHVFQLLGSIKWDTYCSKELFELPLTQHNYYSLVLYRRTTSVNWVQIMKMYSFENVSLLMSPLKMIAQHRRWTWATFGCTGLSFA